MKKKKNIIESSEVGQYRKKVENIHSDLKLREIMLDVLSVAKGGLKAIVIIETNMVAIEWMWIQKATININKSFI